MTKNDFLEFLALVVKVRIFNIKDFIKTFYKYYSNINFAKVDLALLSSYFFKSPYLINRTMNLECYGETPLSTLETIANIANITPQDIIYELGCGRGRSLFWLACFRKCKIIGVEYNPIFIKKAEKLKLFFKIKNAFLLLEDMRKVDLQDATIIYLYGTLLSEADIKIMIDKFLKLKKGVRIATISYALNEYTGNKNYFKIIKEFDVEFAWGKTSAFLQEVL